MSDDRFGLSTDDVYGIVGANSISAGNGSRKPSTLPNVSGS